MKDKNILDKIRGSMIGGGIGDALGYPVEFLSYTAILKYYGQNGITSYKLLRFEEKAVVSDDTQMTLFTANGLLNCFTKNKINGTNNSPEEDIYKCYLDWLECQDDWDNSEYVSWLYKIKELHAARAPGITCVNALASGQQGSVANPLNDRKGCGGVMRVAPIGLFYDNSTDIEEIMKLAAEAAAITHGHSLGYIPAAAFAHIVNRIVYGGCTLGNSLEDIVKESSDYAVKLYKNDEYINYYASLIEKAVEFTKNDRSDVENIEEIGGGWVAEEALAIAIYCSVKYFNDFDKAIIASVNHSGDSDSTGAITGNIVGALSGYDNISDKWKSDIELKEVILEIADDLFEKYSDTKEWRDKYFISQ